CSNESRHRCSITGSTISRSPIISSIPRLRPRSPSRYGDLASKAAPTRNGGFDDQKTRIRRIPPLFAQSRSEDREAAQPGHVQDAGGRRKARARGSVLQAALTGIADGRPRARRRGQKKSPLEEGAGKGDPVGRYSQTTLLAALTRSANSSSATCCDGDSACFGPWSIPSGSRDPSASASQYAANSGANLSIAVSCFRMASAHIARDALATGQAIAVPIPSRLD